jgi:N-sulfoglucosamine sulfohydrolase
MTAHDIGRHLHCYGKKSVRSPHLDALAAGGVRLDAAFATAPQCSASRASLASGMYPHNNGVMGLSHAGFDWQLSVPHAAALLAAAGFETHLFGDQHVTQRPETLGFEHLHPIAEALGEALAARRSGKVFIEINFGDTHRPYPAAQPSADIAVPGYLPPGPEATAEIAGAEAAIAQMDAAVGRVLEAVERSGRAASTLVIFTTDHGLPMPRAKCTLYDPGIEVALMARWPEGGLKAGSVTDELVSNIDVLPTLLEAAGVSPPSAVQGRSLLPLLRGESHQARNAIFAEKTFHSYYDPMRCIRTRTHKFIRNFETAFAVEVPADIQRSPIFQADPSRYSADRLALTELYDLEADPLEERNLSGTMEVREVERRLNEVLWRWMEETEDPLLKGPVPSPRYRAAMQR